MSAGQPGPTAPGPVTVTNMHGLSDTVMDHFLHPRNAGPLPEASGEGWSGNVESGRYMRIQVRLADGCVVEAGFGTYGCAPAIAAGSYLTEWVRGCPVEKARTYTSERLLQALGGLPRPRRYCAELAVTALRTAIDHALQASPVHALGGDGETPPD